MRFYSFNYVARKTNKVASGNNPVNDGVELPKLCTLRHKRGRVNAKSMN